MGRLTDKLVLFLFCLVFYIQNRADLYAIVPVLIALTGSALNSLWSHDYFRSASYSAYTLACLYAPALLFFVPLLAYDIPRSKWRYVIILAVLPLAIHYPHISSASFVSIVLFVALARLMNYQTARLENTRQEIIELRDSAKEFSLQLEGKNRELMERQDYAINLATLEERNRIARDIHDSLGHLLASSILQTGALIAGCRDESLKESLNTLKATLTQGMDGVRQSIHDLHDDSLDLYVEVRKLTDSFYFCPVSLTYDMRGIPDKKLSFAFIAIVKEALSNIMKHSDASQVRVSLREHPGLYQLVVEDNGSAKPVNPGGGIGIKNISDRVAGLGGNLNIYQENGFVIFISVPKEVSS